MKQTDRRTDRIISSVAEPYTFFIRAQDWLYRTPSNLLACSRN